MPIADSRTSAEAIANSNGSMAAKIGDLEFPDFTQEERTGIIEAMNSLKETLEDLLCIMIVIFPDDAVIPFGVMLSCIRLGYLTIQHGT